MKDNLYKQIINKQGELIAFLKDELECNGVVPSLITYSEIKSELAKLKAELEKTDEKTGSDLTDAEITAEARQYAIHHSNAPDKDCPEWIIMDFEAGAKWARMKTIGVIQDLTIK